MKTKQDVKRFSDRHAEVFFFSSRLQFREMAEIFLIKEKGTLLICFFPTRAKKRRKIQNFNPLQLQTGAAQQIKTLLNI